MKILSACCFLLLVLLSCGAHVGAARRRREYNYKLLVFGDSFVDAGNDRPPASERDVKSRGWYYPYGSSDSVHGNRATGRYSDGLVQSDFLARILGRGESPSPYRLWRNNDNQKPADELDGVNFAIADSGVVAGGLSQQINQLRRLVSAGDIDLDDSVALVSISGIRDYASVDEDTSAQDITALIEEVTDEIAESVRRLQRLGVSKILVNALPPIGCQPWKSLTAGGYTRCNSKGNLISVTHNTALKQKLLLQHTSRRSSSSMVLDLFTIFNDLLVQNYNNNLAPCCDTADLNGYCGQVDAWGRRLYTVCPNPASFFYWDYVHPTQAAWSSVMQALEDPIKDFLGI